MLVRAHAKPAIALMTISWAGAYPSPVSFPQGRNIFLGLYHTTLIQRPKSKAHTELYSHAQMKDQQDKVSSKTALARVALLYAERGLCASFPAAFYQGRRSHPRENKGLEGA